MRRAQLQQSANAQDDQLIAQEEKMEAMQKEVERMKREVDLMKKKLDECDSKSTFLERVARLVPSRSDLESTGPVCHICEFEYDETRIPKVLSEFSVSQNAL